MVAFKSRMMPLGTEAPGFSLPDADANMHSYSDADGAKAKLVMFICNHCPFVKHIRRQLARVCNAFLQKDVAVFAINSNDVENYPDDAPDKMKQEIATQGYRFPYLLDEDQSIAKAYDAACTPDFFLFDSDDKLVYRGQFDSSRPSNAIPASGSDLVGAIDAVLSGKPVNEDQIPSIGCNIKWKPGNEPDWF